MMFITLLTMHPLLLSSDKESKSIITIHHVGREKENNVPGMYRSFPYWRSVMPPPSPLPIVA